MTTYDNYHLAISKQTFERKKLEGLYRCVNNSLSIQEHEPSYDLFKTLIDRYGGPWGWNRREKYHDKQEEIERRLSQPETRLLTLHDEDREIGYCLVVGMSKSLSSQFWERATDHRVIEIENFALDVAENGKGKGQVFLQRILDNLLGSYDTVYLSSRSTNHKGVIPFYQKMGMSVFHVERNLPDDLAPLRAIVPSQDNIQPVRYAEARPQVA